MSENSLSTTEVFHNDFFYFVESLSMMTLDAARKRDVMASASAAWELQHDVMEFGAAVKSGAGGFLDQSQNAALERFLEEVKDLPSAVLSSGGDALSHPRWAQIRVGAAHLMELLALPIAENQAFFKKYKPLA